MYFPEYPVSRIDVGLLSVHVHGRGLGLEFVCLAAVVAVVAAAKIRIVVAARLVPSCLRCFKYALTLALFFCH